MARPTELDATRIFGVAAHIDAGKTTVSERMLFVSGVQFRPGLVDEGTTVMDFEEEERERGITIHSAAIELPWSDYRFTLIDTPGHVDFTAEVERCMRVLDGCVLVLDSSQGVEAQSETVWRQMQAHGVRPICFLNKLDKVGADWDASLQSIIDRLGAEPVPLQLPWTDANGEIAVVDLVGRRLWLYAGHSASAEATTVDWPDEHHDEWELARAALAESVAAYDEELLDAFVEDDAIGAEALRAAIRRQTLAGTILPVLGGAALRGIGVEPLMDAVGDYLPSPLDREAPIATDSKGRSIRLELDPGSPFAAQVFKVVASRHGTVSWLRVYQGSAQQGDQVRNSRTAKVDRLHGLFHLRGGDTEVLEHARPGDVVAAKGLKNVHTGDALCATQHSVCLPPWTFPLPVIAMAVEARRVDDREKLMSSLGLLRIEDPTMDWRINDETGQLLVSGMGELHLEILANKLHRDFHLDVQLGRPRVAYRESLRAEHRVARVIERHLPGKDVRVFLDVEIGPAPDQDLPLVEQRIPEDALPTPQGRLLRESCVESLRADLSAGLSHGFPATQIRAVIRAIGDDDSPVPAPEDVEAALSQLLRELGRSGDVTILEPWMTVLVQVPEDCLSPVLGDIQAAGGEVQNVEVLSQSARVRAVAPLSKMLDFTTRLRSLTKGRGASSMELDRYREVDRNDFARLTGV